MSLIRLHKKVEYGLIALRHMAAKRPGELTSAKEICESFQLPFDGTARVLQILANQGILKSEQGVQGGYQIIRDLRKHTLLEFMEIVLGPQAVVRCLQHGGETCELRGSCNIRGPVEVLNDRMLEFLRGIPLSEIVASQIPAARTTTERAISKSGSV